jgi:hypothetical protein
MLLTILVAKLLTERVQTGIESNGMNEVSYENRNE